MGITCWNKVTHYSHAWIHTLRSSMLIIAIASHQIEANNLGSQPNNKKQCEKDEREVCQLNLYPIVNYGSYKSQSWVWHFWKPYFCNPCFTVCTIRLANSFASGWSCEVMQWSINVFSHNFWNSPRNFIPWLVRTSVGAPNLLSTYPKMHMLFLNCYNPAMESMPTTCINVQS